MSAITLFAVENFTGSSENYAIDKEDYKSVTSLPEVRSLKVSSGNWIVYSEANYNGTIAVYKAGAYKSDLKITHIGSFRKLSGPLENQEITVFEQINYQGPQKDFNGVEYPYVPTPIMSHRVVSGVWILYDDAAQKGHSIVSIKGDDVPDETKAGLSGEVKSLKAYLTYEPNP